MVIKFIDEVKDVIESSLPASSASISKVIQTIYDHSSNARDVAETIEHDPILTANILKIANSSYYGCSSTISSLQRAVVILGYDTIKELISSVGFISNFTSDENNNGNIITGLWYHSVGTAKACKFIAQKMYVARPDIAYVIGLLHDIGKIIITFYFPERYSNVLKLAAEKNTRIILAERKLLKTDHTVIGQLLCDCWSLPEDISIPILNHHDPGCGKKDSQKMARLVELGDYMSRKALIGFPGDEKTIQPSLATLALLGSKQDIIEENFEAIFEKLKASISEIENFFHELESK